MNAFTQIEMEGVVERFDDLGALEEGWQATSKADIREEEETRMSVGRVRRAFWITALVLLLLNSAGLMQLAQGLSIGPVQDIVIAMTETWNSEMKRHGVTDVLSTIRTRVAEYVKRPWDAPNEGAAMGDDASDLRLGTPSAELHGHAAILRGSVQDHPGLEGPSPSFAGS